MDHFREGYKPPLWQRVLTFPFQLLAFIYVGHLILLGFILEAPAKVINYLFDSFGSPERGDGMDG